MNRLEEIWQAFQNYKSVSETGILSEGDFIAGAEWSDEHPKSKYNISDADYVKLMLDDIINIAERTTSGNISHNIAAIKVNAKMALKTIKKI